MTVNFDLLAGCRFDTALLDEDWNTTVNGGIPSKFMLLPYVFDRYVVGAKVHNWAIPADLNLQRLNDLCEEAVQSRDAPQKLRILLSESGDIAFQISPILHVPHSLIYAATINPTVESLPSFLPTVPVYLDIEQTPSSIFTATKTTNRPHYDAARNRFNIPPIGHPLPPDTVPPDVILYNSEDQLMETSIRNFALYRSGQWVTPSLTTGCLSGIMRRLLMEKSLIVEGILYKNDVKTSEAVLLFNGAEGCRLGVIVR